MSLLVRDFDIHNRPLIRKFVHYPYTLYRDDRRWVPSLNLEYFGSRLLGQVGMMQTEFPFHQEAKTRFFLAEKNGQVVGRISASINYAYEKNGKDRLGTFGFFECINDPEVAQALLEKAEAWCGGQQAKKLQGPYSFSVNNPLGILIEGFDELSMIYTVYNPPYYADLLEACGLQKCKDVYSYIAPSTHAERDRRLERLSTKINKRLSVKVRGLRMHRLHDDIRLFVDLYNVAWKDKWGFLPLTESEIDHIASSLKSILIPDIFLFAEVDEQLAAVIGNIPNINDALHIKRGWVWHYDPLRLLKFLWKKPRIDTARTIMFGIHPDYQKRGVGSLLFYHSFATGQKLGFKQVEFGWLREEDHLIIHTCEAMQGRRYKTHRIYEKPIKNRAVAHQGAS